MHVSKTLVSGHLIMADVTDIAGVQCGTEAVIYGDGSDSSMTIDEASKLAGPKKNHLLARMSARPPRIYTKKA